MSTKKINKNIRQTEASKFIIFGLILVVLVIIIIGLSSYYIGKNDGKAADSPIPVIDLSQQTQLKILGDKIFNWTGEITKIDRQALVFTAQIKNSEGNIEIKEITAKINSATVLQKWNLAQPANPDQPDNNKQEVTFDQLKAGQEIIVRSAENLNNKNEINAESISLLLTPTSPNL